MNNDPQKKDIFIQKFRFTLYRFDMIFFFEYISGQLYSEYHKLFYFLNRNKLKVITILKTFMQNYLKLSINALKFFI